MIDPNQKKKEKKKKAKETKLHCLIQLEALSQSPLCPFPNVNASSAKT